MRKRGYIFPALLGFVVLLGACSTAPPEQAPEIVEEKKPEFRRVVEEVQLVSKKLSYYWDGVLASYTNYQYAEEGLLKLEEVYNSDDEVQERKVAKYDEGRIRSLDTLDAQNDLVRYHLYRYDEQGRLIEDELYDRRDELQTRQEYEYNQEGQRTRWSVYNSDGALLSYTLYEYEDGLNVRSENYSPSGELLDYFVYEYDSRDNRSTREWFRGDGSLEESREYEYRDGALVEERILRPNGSLKQRIEYRNNDMGNPVEVVYMDAGGTVQEQFAFEYITKEVVTQVPVEE